jgi:hypothetical protein
VARDKSESARIYFDHIKGEDSEEEAETRWEGRGGHDLAHVGVALLKQSNTTLLLESTSSGEAVESKHPRARAARHRDMIGR